MFSNRFPDHASRMLLVDKQTHFKPSFKLFLKIQQSMSFYTWGTFWTDETTKKELFGNKHLIWGWLIQG